MSDHEQHGGGCTGCDWISSNILKTFRVEHAEHAARHKATTEKVVGRVAAVLRDADPAILYLPEIRRALNAGRGQ